MGHLLRELGPWCPEVLAGVLENSVGSGDLCGQAPTGKVVPPLFTLRSCCSHWAFALLELGEPSLAWENWPDPSSGEGKGEAIPPPKGRQVLGSPSC